VIQRCGETPHSVSSHLVVGVAALVTKLFRTSLPFFFFKKKEKGLGVKIFVYMSISFQCNTHPCHLNFG
jgi:hypothetical protein